MSAFEVGSTSRARTIEVNAWLSRTSNPEQQVGVAKHVPQQPSSRSPAPAPAAPRPARVQALVEFLLPGLEPLAGDLRQHRQCDLVVRRTRWRHDPAHPAVQIVEKTAAVAPDDVPHLPHEQGHLVRLPGTPRGPRPTAATP